MSNITPFNPKTLPAAIADLFRPEADDDLSAGVSGGFAVMSIQGSKWRIKHHKETTLVTNEEGDAKSALEVVLVKASSAVSKIFYKQKFTEDSADKPDCFSLDGQRPDPSVAEPVSRSCAACPKNVFGSRTTDTGKAAKACSDHRRVAIVPVNDIPNERFGGAMLLRIPATTLTDLADYGRKLKQTGYPYNAVVTKLAFDSEAAYPKITFKAVRPLNADELAQVATHLQGDQLGRILHQADELAEAQEPAAATFDREPEPAPAPKAAAPKPAPKPKPAPVAKPQVEDDNPLSGGDTEPPAPAAKPAAAAPKASAPEPTGDAVDNILDSLFNDMT